MMATTLQGTDIKTTRLGFGCAQLMRVGSASARARLLETAFDAGIRHFDVARMYGLGMAEGELGKFARGKRDQLVLATKFGIDINPAVKRAAAIQSVARRVMSAFPAVRKWVRRGGSSIVQPHDFSVTKAQSSLETSLRALGTDHIDIFFLHEPALQDDISPDLISFLEQARSKGLIRAFGLSGDFPDVYGLSQRFPQLASIVQFPNDLLTRVLHRDDWSQQRAILTYSPFSKALPAISEYLVSDARIMRQWSEQLGIDCRSGENIATLLLQYCLHANGDGCVVFSSTRPDRIRQLATASEQPPPALQNGKPGALADAIAAYRHHPAGTR